VAQVGSHHAHLHRSQAIRCRRVGQGISPQILTYHERFQDHSCHQNVFDHDMKDKERKGIFGSLGRRCIHHHISSRSSPMTYIFWFIGLMLTGSLVTALYRNCIHRACHLALDFLSVLERHLARCGAVSHASHARSFDFSSHAPLLMLTLSHALDFSNLDYPTTHQ